MLSYFQSFENSINQQLKIQGLTLQHELSFFLFQFSKLKDKIKFLKGRKHLEKTYNRKPNSHIKWFTCYKITPVLISHLFSPFHTCITTIALSAKRSPTDAWGYFMRDVS